MNSKTLHRMYSLAMPGGLLLAAAVLLTHFPVLPASAWQMLPWLPYAIFAAGALLSWRFNRSRLLWAMIVLALVYGALSVYVLGRTRHSAGDTVFACITLLLPMNLVAFALMRERGTTRFVGQTWLGLIAAQLLVVAALCRPELAGGAAWLRLPFVQWEFLSRVRVSQLALATFLSAFVVLIVRFFRYPKPLEGGFFWTLICLFIALNGTSGQGPGLYFATAGFILVASLIEMSHHMAFRDELTGLPGRRAFNEAALKLGENYALAMVDVDHFKKFNDTYGHDCGDQVLRLVGAKLEAVTGGGQAFRYGGEEFTVIFPGKTTREAMAHLEDLRQNIADARFAVRGPDRRKNAKSGRAQPRPAKNTTVQVTVSIGVAKRDERNELFEKVVRAADKALYRAKEAGRNCVKGVKG